MAKRKKGKPEWIKQTLDLKDDHRWQSKPGYKVFVADRGSVRFDVPGDWVFEPDEKSFKFTDRKPPNDDCRLEMSFSRLPDGDWDLFPLKATLKRLLLTINGTRSQQVMSLPSSGKQRASSGQKSNLSIQTKIEKPFHAFALA